MEEAIQQNFCSKHKEEFIAIDISSDCDDRNRHCCALCIQQSNNKQEILTYKQANQYLSKQKKQFKEQKEAQLLENFNILTQLKEKVVQVQDHQNKKFNELATQIQQQIGFIEQDNQQFNTKLSQVDIESYLSGSNLFAQAFDNLQSFKKSLKNQLDEIMKDHKFDELRHQIQLINIEKITLFPETIEKKQKLSNTIDYSLSFLCLAHNQQIVKFDLSGTTAIENRMLCDGCLKYRQGTFKNLIDVFLLWDEYKKQQFYYLNENQKAVNCKIEPLIQLMQDFKAELDNRIRKQILAINERVQRVKVKQNNNLKQQQSIEWSSLNFFQIQEIIETLISPNYLLNISSDQNKEFEALKNYIEDGIKGFLIEYKSMETYFKQQLNQIDFNFQESTSKTPENVDQVYQIMNSTQKNNCDAIALSEHQDTLVVGCEREIHVYNFDKGKLLIKQILKQHKTIITKLSFMKSSKQFVSVCKNQLIIWTFDNNMWELEEQLQQIHSDKVQCLIIGDNMIITGSFDQQIKFWIKNDFWQLGQTLQIHDGQIQDMNLNNNQNQLVSCGQMKPRFFSSNQGQILISGKGNQNKWDMVQIIKSEKQVNRVCYIGDDKIIYQTKSDITLLVQNSKQIFEVQKILFHINDDSNIFPLSFNKSKELLIFKNQFIINVVKLLNNGEWSFQQLILIKSDHIIGTLSNDGQFLITWNAESKEIQVRKTI